MSVNTNQTREPLFSLRKLKSITSGDEKAMRHFNEVFLQETLEKDLNSLRQNLESGNMSEVNRCAHKMKSSLDLYCIDSISHEIREIEDLAKEEQEVNKIPEILVSVESTLAKVKEQIAALL